MYQRANAPRSPRCTVHCPLLLLAALSALPAQAGDLRNFDDAALHAVQFTSPQEGWVVGDEGVILHTIDGGRTWERRPTGVRASLRGVQFLNFHTGWVVGREELPHGAGSTGVMLFTRDGGFKWQRLHPRHFPGLNCIRFVDERTGFIAGDATDHFPTGLFQTSDAGQTWKAVAGPRCTSWLAMDSMTGIEGILAGAWHRLALLRDGHLSLARAGRGSPDPTDAGRNLRCIRLGERSGVAVGQGGQMLRSDSAAGSSWSQADLKLPREVLACCDFHALTCVGTHIWTAGRPGSVVLHSNDSGRTWEVQRTGQSLPLNCLCFIDENRGWAVGELGLILTTQDGGKTWQVQRCGGQRAAALFVHARATSLPVDSMAILGGEHGYLTAAVRVTSSDPSSASPNRASESHRWNAAVRMAGGGAGETLWQFPLPQHHLRRSHPAPPSRQADGRTVEWNGLLQSWDRLHPMGASEELLRQMVLAIRIWQPDVLIADHPDSHVTGYLGDAMVAEAVREAFQRAADPACFPEQIRILDLKPWQAVKLYGCWHQASIAHVVQALVEPACRLGVPPRDFAAPALACLSDVPLVLPAQRYYRLLEHRLQDASHARELMAGAAQSAAGTARRHETPVAELSAETLKAIRTGRALQALTDMPISGLVDADRLAQLSPALKQLPDQQAAPLAFAVANQHVRRGQWELARDIFSMMLERYPTHPLSADACCWLIRHASSSPARRRQERRQFLVMTESQLTPKPVDQDTASAGFRLRREQQHGLVGNDGQGRQWYQRAIELEPRLSAFGTAYATDPSLQFCVQSARRNLHDFENARKWYAQFVAAHPEKSAWRDAAAAELWLLNRSGPCPKPTIHCRAASTPPYLDGKLDDACWQVAPVVLGDAVGETSRNHKTEAWLAFDDKYLYLAVRCQHPADSYVEPVKARPRNADVRAYDRVNLLLDLDRNYNTYYRLQIDQRGCVCDDCWGDLNWNPRWHVAVKSDETGWQAEAAIPFAELTVTGEPVQPGTVWAANVVRVLPGRGVQALAIPGERAIADVEPRPEGMGLLHFIQNSSRRQ